MRNIWLAILLVPVLAWGQPRSADDWYKVGANQYNLGNFDKAVDAFKQGFSLETDESKKASYLYNIAQSYRLVKDCKNAQFFYKRFLALKETDSIRPLPAKTRKDVEERIDELETCVRGVPAPAAAGVRAGAGSKPTIAILGLEVYDNGSGIDPETTKAAKELTAVLRDRARAGTGPCVPVPNGEKELVSQKLLNNCDTEAPVCMAAIGSELGADLLMYGKIEKAAQGAQPIYKVSIKVLDVSRRQLSSSTVETVPLAEATGVRASGHAKAWYMKLVAGPTGGTVVVKANIDRGTVFLDEEAKGNLASGTLTLNRVPEGRHTLAIEAKDYQRYEASITVRTGETTALGATMVRLRAQ